MGNIIKWCKKMGIENFSIVDGKINVDGEVNISVKKLTCIPYPFGIVNGSFLCANNKLISLKNCPNIVNGYFDCYCNNLISLEYSPNIVGLDFHCNRNSSLLSLKGIGQVNGDIFTDLENDPIYLFRKAKKKFLYG